MMNRIVVKACSWIVRKALADPATATLLHETLGIEEMIINECSEMIEEHERGNEHMDERAIDDLIENAIGEIDARDLVNIEEVVADVVAEASISSQNIKDLEDAVQEIVGEMELEMGVFPELKKKLLAEIIAALQEKKELVA